MQRREQHITSHRRPWEQLQQDMLYYHSQGVRAANGVRGMVTKLVWEGLYTSLYLTLISQVKLQARRGTGNVQVTQQVSGKARTRPRAPGYLHSTPTASHMARAQVGIREDFQKQGLPDTLTLGSPWAGGTRYCPRKGPIYLLCNLG